MVDLTRRNFLLGVTSSAIATLLASNPLMKLNHRIENGVIIIEDEVLEIYRPLILSGKNIIMNRCSIIAMPEFKGDCVLKILNNTHLVMSGGNVDASNWKPSNNTSAIFSDYIA